MKIGSTLVAGILIAIVSYFFGYMSIAGKETKNDAAIRSAISSLQEMDTVKGYKTCVILPLSDNIDKKFTVEVCKTE